MYEAAAAYARRLGASCNADWGQAKQAESHVVGLWWRINEPLAVHEVGELQALGDGWLARREAIEIACCKLDPNGSIPAISTSVDQSMFP